MVTRKEVLLKVPDFKNRLACFELQAMTETEALEFFQEVVDANAAQYVKEDHQRLIKFLLDVGRLNLPF